MQNSSLPFLLYHVDDLDPVETGFQPVLGRQGCLPYQILLCSPPYRRTGLALTKEGG
jgi:hypothetical protein